MRITEVPSVFRKPFERVRSRRDSSLGEPRPTAFDLTAQQRDALYGQILDYMSGIDNVPRAARNGDYEVADRLGREFAEDLRLVTEDLGWGDKSSQPVALTRPPAELRRVLGRVSDRAAAQIQAMRLERAEECAEERALIERARTARDACKSILGEIDGRKGGESGAHPSAAERGQ